MYVYILAHCVVVFCDQVLVCLFFTSFTVSTAELLCFLPTKISKCITYIHSSTNVHIHTYIQVYHFCMFLTVSGNL